MPGVLTSNLFTIPCKRSKTFSAVVLPAIQDHHSFAVGLNQ